MTYRKYLRALAIPTLLSLTACSSVSSIYSSDAQKPNREDEQLALSNSHWQVESINQAGIIDFSHVSLNVNSIDGASRLSGSTGCNQYASELNINHTDGALGERSEAQVFATDNIILTKKMCAPALMKQEQRFVDALSSTKTFAILDNTWLVLYDSESNETVKAVIADSSLTSAKKRAKPRHTEMETLPQALSKKQDVVDANVTTNISTYECETPNASTRELRVNALGADTLALSINNTHHIVQLSRSASGAKYTNNKGVVFWNKGDAATLSINSGHYFCQITSVK